jgi:tRNA(Ile2)-agmatinylcytidine synthase
VAAIWIGIDDTDSPEGGCTTWVLTEVVRAAREVGLDLLGEPRLVRLNPNIPWKTRGNAALAARFGRGVGASRSIGEIDGQPVVSFRRGHEAPTAARQRFVGAAWARVEALSARAPATDPALVASTRPLPASLYWQAVRELVPVPSVRETLARYGAEVRLRDGPQGIVGAAAAIAWPGRRVTWELIAYRCPLRFGTPREVDAESVRRAARRHPELFLCDDPRTRRLLVSPHTPCPILFGLRSRRAESLPELLGEVRSETIDRWMVFRTNQGTGDHIVPRVARQLAPYLSAEVEGIVAEAPSVMAGGHVRFGLADPEGTLLPCLAFEPTKTLPKVAQGLEVGDRLRVWGSVGRTPGLRVEGIRLLRLAASRSWENPVCPSCRRRAGSLGRLRGFRCHRCHRRWAPEAARRRPRARRLSPGEYHPTPSARRHLAPRAPER